MLTLSWSDHLWASWVLLNFKNVVSYKGSLSFKQKLQFWILNDSLNNCWQKFVFIVLTKYFLQTISWNTKALTTCLSLIKWIYQLLILINNWLNAKNITSFVLSYVRFWFFNLLFNSPFKDNKTANCLIFFNLYFFSGIVGRYYNWFWYLIFHIRVKESEKTYLH